MSTSNADKQATKPHPVLTWDIDDPKWKEMWLDFFYEKKYRLTEENLSYRVVSHWEKLGLISSNRPADKGWRKYSIYDLMWLHIVMELRSVGYPLEQIKHAWESLEGTSTHMGDYPRDTNFLAIGTLGALRADKQKQIYLAVAPNSL